MCNAFNQCVQYQPSCAPKLARKGEIEHWFPCGAGGRTVSRAAGGRAVYGNVITKFSRMGSLFHFLTHGALLRAGAPQSTNFRTLFTAIFTRDQFASIKNLASHASEAMTSAIVPEYSNTTTIPCNE